MLKSTYRNFILDNSLAAVSAIPYTDYTLATDGSTCVIHKIAPDGTNLHCHPTLRPLRRIRSVDSDCLITALGCCNNPNLYILNHHLAEQDSIEIRLPYRSYNADCTTYGFCNHEEGIAEMTDASIVTIGSQRYIAVAYTKGAYLYDLNGICLAQLCKTDCNEILTDFICLPDGAFAMVTLCGNTQTFSICRNDTMQSAVLSHSRRLRMLIEENGEIYGLFGKNYIYNQIIKIFSDSILVSAT